jgi:hypothetical protein
MYRQVVESDECPASSCTSLSDLPTAPIFLTALVMNPRRPLWLEQPLNARARYQTANRLTIAPRFYLALSVVTTNAPDLSLLNLNEGGLLFLVEGNDPAGGALARPIHEMDRVADLSRGVG